MKTRLIPIDSIKIEESVYPRTMIDWQTVERYAQSMQMGAEFPPLEVTKIGNQIIIIDGVHRLNALKRNKEKYAKVVYLKVKDLESVFIEALKRNVIHGRPLSFYERLLAFQRLKQNGISIEKISAILQIPRAKLINYVQKRTAMDTAGEEIILKRPLDFLAGQTDLNISKEKQRMIDQFTQVKMLSQVILLFKNHWINRKNKKIKKLIQELKNYL